jgi:predicted DNA-binding transcriptional regulator AlpA
MTAIERDPRALLAIDEVLTVVRVKRRTLMNWVSRGKFPKPCKPHDGINLWLWCEVKAWVDALDAKRGQSR